MKKNLNGGQDNNIRNVYNDKMSKSKARKKINQYVIHLDEPLGSGAYASVFLAHDEQSHSQFAAKIV